MDGYDGFAGNEQLFDDVLTGNDPATYDSLSNFQAMDDIITGNQGYGWDITDDWGGSVWATGNPSVDASNFGDSSGFDSTEQQFDDIINGD